MTDDDTFLATPAAVSPTPTTRTGVPPIPTAGTGAGADPSPAALLAPQTSRLAERRAQLGDHGGLVCNISDDLADDVDDLWGQEGWDPATAAGALEWAGDCGMVFRALRRNHFDGSKAHAFLLSALSARIERGLGGAIPPPPSGVWSLLPLPRFTDRLGHPIAVLTIRDVARDSGGSLAELKEWTWSGLELTRRALRDYWVDQRRGTGAEGAVLVVDAGGAGYRNMEVELLPTIFSVGRNNFPGLFQNVYVVNAGWSQRALWSSVISRVLPRRALDKVSFLNSRQDIAAVFDMDRFPKALGGSAPPPDLDASLRRYSHPRPPNGTTYDSRPGSRVASRSNSRAGSRANSRGPSRSGSRAPSRDRPEHLRELDRLQIPSRNTSMSSIADVYFTASNSPVSSRPSSRPSSRHGSSLALAGLSSRLAMTKTATLDDEDEGAGPRTGDSSSTAKAPLAPLNNETPLPTTGAIETDSNHRIKSLTDFHLYLSPSRLAHRDLLSDSEDDEPLPAPRRRILRPAMLEGNLAARRAAAKLRAASPPDRSSTPAQSYASQLQAHHANGLDKYCGEDADCSQFRHLDPSYAPSEVSDSPAETPPTSIIDTDAASQSGASASMHGTPPPVSAADVQFSADNPWWGYPVVRVQDGSIRPRYGRNRKRDLVKTLLWLFVLRLQAWRSAFERALGLDRLFKRSTPPPAPRTPTQGLRDTAAAHKSQQQPSTVAKRSHHDWIWMLIGFLLMRGTWAPLVSAPFDAVGLSTVKELLFGFV